MASADPSRGAHHLPGEVTRRARSSFYYAFLFLPPDQRAALDAVYAFCRLVDDDVDDAPSPEDARTRVDTWRRRLDLAYGEHRPARSADDEGELLGALWWAVRTYRLDRADFEAVLTGCACDASATRYPTWAALRTYCERVASSVGLLSIAVFGARDPRARPYAIELGVALQLVNILRDIDEDGARGRIYLPGEDLAAFGVSEAELLSGVRTPSVRRLLTYEADRARLHALRARSAIGEDERARLFVAEIMGDIYLTLLDELQAAGFPHGRLNLPRRRKALVALRRYALARLHRA